MCSFFFCKQKTEYEVRISDWSSDVCSSDLQGEGLLLRDRPSPSPSREREGSLEAAQARKIRTLLDRLDLRPGQRLLEIGCGWGPLAEIAARDYGVQRSEERRVGQGCVCTCKFRWSASKSKNTTIQYD